MNNTARVSTQEQERPNIDIGRCTCSTHETRQSGPKDEEEEQRLHKRRDHPQPIAAEANELATPHNFDGAPIAAPTARGTSTETTVIGGTSLVVVIGLPPSCKLRWRPRPTRNRLVCIANRGAGVGHKYVVERGSSHTDRPNRHAHFKELRDEALTISDRERQHAIRTRDSIPNFSRMASLAASSSSVRISTLSLPTCALSAAGVSGRQSDRRP